MSGPYLFRVSEGDVTDVLPTRMGLRDHLFIRMVIFWAGRHQRGRINISASFYNNFRDIYEHGKINIYLSFSKNFGSVYEHGLILGKPFSR